MSGPARKLIPDPFILLLVGTVALASVAPAQDEFAVIAGWIASAAVSLLLFFHGVTSGVSGVGEIAVQILLPFVAGHLFRPSIGAWLGRHKRMVGYTDRSTILIAVYGAFSAAVTGGAWTLLSAGDLVVLLAICVGLLVIGLGFTWTLGAVRGFDLTDRIALLFCGTKKSLLQDVPMADMMFPGSVAGFVLLPITIFHQIQFMTCAVIARRLLLAAPQRGRDIAYEKVIATHDESSCKTV